MFSRSRSRSLHGASPDDLGLDILYPPAGTSDQGAIVDIVFVHGLGGSRYGTWTKGDVLWPQTILAQDFPKARIMTWGYDADVIHFFGPVGKSNVQDHAKDLNRDLLQERFEDYQASRPIIFVAHSLGGLIVKDALFLSYREGVKEAREGVDQRLAAIKSSTKGVLFAGTPHRGTDKAKWAATATNLAWYIQKHHSNEMLNTLKRGSEVLERLQDNFKDILEHFAIYTLIEDVPYKIGKIVEKDSAIIGWHEKEIHMHANHSDMIKFGNSTENDYKRVRFAFREIIKDRIDGVRPETNVQSDPSSRSNSRQWLSDVPRSSSQHISRSRQQGLLAVPNESSPGDVLLRCAESVEQPVKSGESMNSRLAELNEAQKFFRGDFTKNMEQGTRFLKQRDQNHEQNLITARTYFALARGVLLKSSNPDPESFIQIYYQLMNVEMEMSYNKGSAEEKMSHLQAAEFYGAEASSWARRGGSVGGLAQVMLQQAVLKGRRAEVDARLGMSPQEVRRQKDEAISGITGALQQLQHSKRSNLEGTTAWAMNWLNRFQPTS